MLLSKTLTIIATCYKTWGTVGIVSSLANLRNIIRTVADFIIQWENRANMKNAVTSPFCSWVAQRHPRRKKFLRNRNRTGAVFQWLYKDYEERFNLHESRISFNCYTGIIRHTSKLVFLIPVIKRSLQISCKKWKWRKFSENWQSIWHWMEYFKLNSGKT